MAKRPQSAEKSILDRIRGHGRGWVFTPRHFLDLASRPAITSAVRRSDRGRHDPPAGPRPVRLPEAAPDPWPPPTPEALARAMAGRDRVRLQPSGAYAANLLGLSEQVPAKVVFLTDGPSRVVRVGPTTLQLRHTHRATWLPPGVRPASSSRPSGILARRT